MADIELSEQIDVVSAGHIHRRRARIKSALGELEVSANLLSCNEVCELTGYEKPSYQAAWLSERSIQHFINARGEVKVLVSALTAKSHNSATEPDFGQFIHATKKSA